MISALLFGSIGVLAETSDIQRRAYNQALDESPLGWSWDETTYRRLLAMSGGKKRLRLLADATGKNLTDAQIDTIHARKTEIACAEVRDTPVTLRPGVAALIEHALANDITLGLVTGTYRDNIDAIADAAGEQLPLDRFAVVLDKTSVKVPKPAPYAYQEALRRCGDLAPSEAIAIEDTAVSVLAAVGAGLTVIATPGQLTDDQQIVGATLVVPDLADGQGVRGDVLHVLAR